MTTNLQLFVTLFLAQVHCFMHEQLVHCCSYYCSETSSFWQKPLPLFGRSHNGPRLITGNIHRKQT